MFRPLSHSLPRWRRAPRRGGAVLLTCFSIITILMVLGLAFMMYAAKEKANAQAYQEAASRSGRPRTRPTRSNGSWAPSSTTCPTTTARSTVGCRC